MDDIADFAIRVAIPFFPTIAVVAICMVLERRWPAASANRGDRLRTSRSGSLISPGSSCWRRRLAGSRRLPSMPLVAG